MYAVLPRQVPDLMKRPDAFALIGRMGYAVRKEQNVHGVFGRRSRIRTLLPPLCLIEALCQ